MPTFDLITSARALAALTALTDEEVALVPTLISAASNVISRYTYRDFVQQDYDQITTAAHNGIIRLDQYPINAIDRIAGNPTAALTIRQADATTNQRATVAFATIGDVEGVAGLTTLGLVLTRVASGVTTRAFLPWAAPPVALMTATATGTDGSIDAGTYLLSYSVVGPGGETPPSDDLTVLVFSNQSLVLTLPNLPSWATGCNIYLSTLFGNRATETLQNSTPIAATTTTLTSTTSGAAPATAGNPTITDLATSITGLGAGWETVVPSAFGLWGTTELIGAEAAQNALGQGADLSVFAADLAGTLIDPAAGLVRLNAGSPFGAASQASLWWGFPGYSGSYLDDAAPRIATGQVRIQYNAGYGSVPEPVQQACVQVVQEMIAASRNDPSLRGESDGAYSWTGRDDLRWLTADVRALLLPFKDFRA